MLLLLRFNTKSDWNLYNPYILCSFIGKVDDKFNYVLANGCFICRINVVIVVGVVAVWAMSEVYGMLSVLYIILITL